MSKLISLDSLEKLDYTKAGLKCGLEIHQQLNTGKLFCTCPCEVVPNDELDKTVERYLRFSVGESGSIDAAALSEFKKKKKNQYKYNDKIACLVDIDEEPPGKPNQSALDTAMRVGLMLNVSFFDTIQFMRKLIIDGSITSGFQRTALLGFGGKLQTSFGDVTIEGVNIEEDASRVIERKEDHNIFSLDRQGIPLIEITTGPQIHEPEQALELAKQLGNVLRSFSETRRGLGTIRQDLNVSIPEGARVEIKGAQNLKLLPEIVKAEVKRQIIHHSILEELKTRKVTPKNFSDRNIYDLTKLFTKTQSKVLLDNLKTKGTGIYGIILNNFKGILGHEMQENFRFATEISERNKKLFPQIKGLFHSDELPYYGITQQEVDAVRKELKLKDQDSFILIAQEKNIAQESLTHVLEILEHLISEVASEVRQVDPKGTQTKFLRPMPGSARMYPETDVKTISVTQEYLKELKKNIPELYDTKIKGYVKKWELERPKVESLLNSYTEKDIEKLLKTSNKTASALYTLLFDLPKDIKKRDKLEPIDFKISLLEDLLKEAQNNNLSQQTIRDIFVSLYKDNKDSVDNLKSYLEEKGFLGEELSEQEVEATLKKVVEQNKGAPFGALMGQAMKAFNGKVDGKRISALLKKLT